MEDSAVPALNEGKDLVEGFFRASEALDAVGVPRNGRRIQISKKQYDVLRSYFQDEYQWQVFPAFGYGSFRFCGMTISCSDL